jgi:type II secretory pathway component PulM
MTALRWLSDSLRRISARERRFVLAGAIASATLVVLVLIVLPFARRWTARETTYAASREQWARLAGLAAGGGRLRRDRDAQRMAQSTEQARLVTGATPALAASSLQGLLQRYAGESAVQLDRVDVAGQPRTDEGGLLAIPVHLQGQGDVYGLVDFLYRLQAGERLLVIEEMTVNAGAWDADGRQTLIWAIRLHGLYAGGGPRS